jgi:hypothetical protein
MCNSGSYLDLTSLFRGNLSDWNLWIVWVKWSFFVATPACPTFSPGTKIGKHLLVTDVVTHLDAGSLQSWCSEALPGAFEPHPLAGAHHLSVQCFDERWGAGRPRRAISPVRQFFSPVGKVFWGRLNLGQRNSLKWIGFKFYLEQLDTLIAGSYIGITGWRNITGALKPRRKYSSPRTSRTGSPKCLPQRRQSNMSIPIK